jgi:hypothetical protein
MPVEAKPLFRPDVLRSHLSGFSLPSVDAAKLEHWADLISRTRFRHFPFRSETNSRQEEPALGCRAEESPR